MTRREFVRGVGLGGLAVAGGTLVPACAATRIGIRGAKPVGSPLSPEEERILTHAALAPSGHNTQPWAVRVAERRRWIVGVDPARKLPEVDPVNRELALSIGAFIENLAVAGAAVGLPVEIERVATARDAPDLVALRLVPAIPGQQLDLERIRLRRTVRKGYRDAPVRPDDRDALLGAYGGAAAWFPVGSREAAWLAAAEVEAFRKQTWRDDAQKELSTWIRFSDDEATRHGDGITPAAMEVGAIAGFFMRHFMGRETVMRKRFRVAGIDQVAAQVKEGAGWLVVTAPDEGTASLLEAGRRFARMALRLRERGLGAHPMSQVLEEEPWRSEVAQELGLTGIPQFTIRVGHVAEYPAPVSPRRPPGAFARVG